MTESDNKIIFGFKEVVTAFLKDKGIHEGLWMLYIEFGFAAVNIPVREDENAPEPEDPLSILMPAMMVPVKKIGIQPALQLSNLAVDAAVVNPRPKGAKKK